VLITRTKKMVLAGAVVVAVAGGGTGIAYAGQSSAPPATGTPATRTPATRTPATGGAPGKPGRHRGGLLSRVEHGEFTVRTPHGNQILDVQRGTVSAVSGQSISVRSPDGFSATYAIGPQTKVRKDRKPAGTGQLAQDDRILVIAVTRGSATTATRIADAGPAR